MRKTERVNECFSAYIRVCTVPAYLRLSVCACVCVCACGCYHCSQCVCSVMLANV